MSISKKKSAAKKPQTSRYSNVKKALDSSDFAKEKILIDTKDVKIGGKLYNVVDLFSGCGGLTKGFEDAGFRSILGVEIDPDAAKTYDANFKDAAVWSGDIHDLSNEEALRMIDGQEVHVLTGGFPCQGFSVAGERNPDDERNQLFRQMIRFTELFNPMFVVCENVPGIITMDDGRFMNEIFDSFRDIGYTITARVLESADFGVPQYRPRTFFIANRFGEDNPYPIELLEQKDHVTIEEAIDDLKEVPRDASINHEWTAHRKDTIERIKKVKPGHSLYDTYADAFKRQYRGLPSMTVKENHGGTHIHHDLDRCISAREMARLQSFPDDFFFQGTMKRAMFQLGNAVPPLLAKHVALALRPTLARLTNHEKIDGQCDGGTGMDGLIKIGKQWSHSKASESYVKVKFHYPKEGVTWDGAVPIEYRRGPNINVDPSSREFHLLLDSFYNYMHPKNKDAWEKKQREHWKSKRDGPTKDLFNGVSHCEWICSTCAIPNNPNWARRWQDLKEDGYTTATIPSHYCETCNGKRAKIIMLRYPREVVTGYETIPPRLRKRILETLGHHDVYEDRIRKKGLLPEHKFPEIRWDEKTRNKNTDAMTAEEIVEKFQLMDNQRNQQKREACRKCWQTGKRGFPYGIKFFYSGNEDWNSMIPKSGKIAEAGCVGCGWYDLQKWREAINRLIE